MRPTAKPPAEVGGLGSTIPPSSVTPLEDGFVMPERFFFERLEERARRAELLTALLQAKGLPPERGVCALQAALGAIVASAEEAQLLSLAALSRALQAALGELGIAKLALARTCDVLVLDDSEISRDLVALAVEAQGHIVRCAADYEDFVRQLGERLPDLIVTEVQLPKAPARQFCDGLVELLATRPVPFVFFSGVERHELDALSRRSGARAAISKERGLGALVPELERVLARL